MTEAIREEIVRVAQALDAAGMMPSKSGNVSVRFGEGFLVTPAALPYAVMTPADVVETAMDGTPAAEAKLPPSSEWRLHAAIYAARPEIGAVVHTHSPRATALSCARRPIPAFHYAILMAGGEIRCAEHATFGTEALAQNTLRGMTDRRAVLLANHGVVAAGGKLASAVTLALEVENLAGEYLSLLSAGLTPVVLNEQELAEAREQFASYGRDK